MCNWIEKLSNLLAGYKTLLLVDDIIANKSLDKQRQPLLGLTILGRHKGHSLWLLTQSYTAVPMNIRRQAQMLYVWYPKKRGDWDTIQEENDITETPEEVASVKKQLKQGKHTCLVMRRFLEYCNKNSYKTPTLLLSRDYRAHISKMIE